MKILSDIPASLMRDLPQDVLPEIVRTLCHALPAPLADGAEALERRDRAAVDLVASLQPKTVTEARMAAQFVMADAHALDCLRLAKEPQMEPDMARKCLAQATGMMREARSALRMLTQMQAKRRATAKKPALAYREALLEQNLIKIMSEALSEAPAAPVRHLRLVSYNKTKSPTTKTETMTGFRLSIVRAAGKGDGPAE